MRRMGMKAVMAVVAALLLFAFGCGGGEVPGGGGVEPPPEEQTVKFLWLLDFTGPLSANHVPAFKGCTAWVKQFNAEGGFKDGTKVEVEWSDTNYRVELAKSAYERAKSDPQLLCIGQSAGAEGEALRPFVDADKMPDILSFASPLNLFPPGYQFATCSFSPESCVVQVKYFAEHTAETLGIAKPVKVGCISGEYGWIQDDVNAIGMFGPESGYEVVINEKVPYPPSDCTASILKLKEAGCDVMFLELSPPGCARIIKDASRLGVYPDMKAIVSHNYCGRDVCDLAGEAGVGAYSATTSGPYFEEKEPSVVKLSQALQKYEGETEVESYDMMPCYGALPMLTFIEACQRGLDHIGYDQMNGETGRQEIYNQLCAMRNCDMGGVGHEISFAPNDRRGSHYLDIVVMEPADDVIPERHWLDISGWLEMPLLSLDQIEEIQKHEIVRY